MLVSPLVTLPPSIWNDGVNYKEHSYGVNYNIVMGMDYKEYSERGQEILGWETG